MIGYKKTNQILQTKNKGKKINAIYKENEDFS